jgi:hypothetical protein
MPHHYIGTKWFVRRPLPCCGGGGSGATNAERWQRLRRGAAPCAFVFCQIVIDSFVVNARLNCQASPARLTRSGRPVTRPL